MQHVQGSFVEQPPRPLSSRCPFVPLLLYLSISSSLPPCPSLFAIFLFILPPVSISSVIPFPILLSTVSARFISLLPHRSPLFPLLSFIPSPTSRPPVIPPLSPRPFFSIIIPVSPAPLPSSPYRLLCLPFTCLPFPLFPLLFLSSMIFPSLFLPCPCLPSLCLPSLPLPSLHFKGA